MSSTRRMRALAVLAALGTAATGLGACGGTGSTAVPGAAPAVTCKLSRPTRIGIAAGGGPTGYAALGEAYATQLADDTGGTVTATASATGTPAQNVRALAAGGYTAAFVRADVAADGIKGAGAFDGSRQPVRALARLYDDVTQVVVRDGAGINSLADLRGKRVATGAPGSGAGTVADQLLRAAGLDGGTDVRVQRLDLAGAVRAMKAGSVDALFWAGALPTPAIAGLFAAEKDRVRFLDLAPLLDDMRAMNPAYTKATIPASTYGTPQAVQTIALPNLLLVREDLDPNLACVLARTLFDRKLQLVRASADANGLSLDTARKTEPVPLSRGAALALGAMYAARTDPAQPPMP